MTHPARPARRATAALLTALAFLGTTAACGDDDAGGAAPSATRTAADGSVFNDADVAFATDMVPHHAQALELVTLTDGRTLDPEVSALAQEIREAQAPEVQTMVGWLTDWDQPVPETSLDHAHGGHGDESGAPMDSDTMDEHRDMPGMVAPDDLEALQTLPDSEFQTRWLELMKGHHEGAVSMAESEVEDGANADAQDLARSIIETQRAEIERIDVLLARAPGAE